MNFDFYLFGTPDGYNQYPWDDKEVLFQSFYDKTCLVQLTIYRKAELVYYAYVRNLNGKGNQYFGMAIVINGNYLNNLKDVFVFFDNLYKSIVNKGQLLSMDTRGIVGFRCSRFVDFPAEIESIERDCRILLEGCRSQTRLPEDYVVQDREIEFAFDSDMLPVTVKLEELLKYYNRIRLTKGKTGKAGKEPPSPKPKWTLFYISLLIIGLLAVTILYYTESEKPTPEPLPQDSIVNQKPDSVSFDTGKTEEPQQPKPLIKKPIPKEEPSVEKPKPKEEQPKQPIKEPKPNPKPKEELAPKNNVRNVTNLGFSEGYYTGTLHGDIIEGHGTFVYTSGDFAGDKYEGGWKNNRFDGYGVYTCNPRNSDYTRLEGCWKNGKMAGKGICYYKNGDRYEGEFVSGQPNGVGKYYSANGERHEGQFKSGLPNGQGKLYYSNGKLKYEGEFKNGLFDGVGTYYFTSGNVYNGLFKNGEKVN